MVSLAMSALLCACGTSGPSKEHRELMANIANARADYDQAVAQQTAQPGAAGSTGATPGPETRGPDAGNASLSVEGAALTAAEAAAKAGNWEEAAAQLGKAVTAQFMRKF